MKLRRELLLALFVSVISVTTCQKKSPDYDGLFEDELSRPRLQWDKDDENCDEGQKCVPYYLCKEDGDINTDGKFLLNPRNEGISSPVAGCTALSMCCNRTDYVDKLPEELCASFKMPKKCGFRNPKGLGGTTGALVDDGVAKNSVIYSNFAEFPWMVVVLERFGDSDTVLAGGSLIHPKVVLTSAHNSVNSTFRNVRVRAGEWNAATINEMCPHEEKNVEKIIRHEKFNWADANFQNDIALIILQEPFKLTPFINTICLPPANTNFDNQICYSSGWGKTNFVPEAEHQLVLKRVTLPVVSHGECQRMLRKTLLGEDFVLHENFLCAGGEEGIDTCTGDGGGALVCEIPGTGSYYQAGIVAAGIQCGKKDIPGLYTDVSKNHEWIRDRLYDNGFDDYGSHTF